MIVALYLSGWLTVLVAGLLIDPGLAVVLAVAGAVTLMALVTVVYTHHRPSPSSTETTIAVSVGLHHRRRQDHPDPIAGDPSPGHELHHNPGHRLPGGTQRPMLNKGDRS